MAKLYDSGWLRKLYAARAIVARVAPSRLADFDAAFRVFRTDPAFTTKTIPSVLDEEARARVKKAIQSIPPDALETHEVKRFGRFVVHEHPAFAELHRDFARVVSEAASEEVEPSYNFLCLYTRMGACEPHLDSPSAKWTLDVCVDQSEPWPIHFSDVVPWPESLPEEPTAEWQAAIKREHRYEAKILEPGDGVVFSGSSQWHYRDAIPRGAPRPFCDLLFFHYVPKGTMPLVASSEWAERFGIPELAELPGIVEDALWPRHA